ncbi:MAG: hypothetical protein DHS20C21_13670 [Gemmatimonadota bacterium]|nr:MAG: hypothetical protein DHS20C21_13670 [Gemmatimonadota bacterium]
MRRWIAMVGMMMLVSVAWAGGPSQEGMMAEMANCSICKSMVPHLDELTPVCSNEIITMSDGMAMYHTVSDESKLELFRSVMNEMDAAGMATASYTDEQIKSELCGFCQGIHGLLSAGAVMSSGMSPNGKLMVITSQDPEVQAKIASFTKNAQEMMGG